MINKRLTFLVRGAVLTQIATLSGHWPVKILTPPPLLALHGTNIVDLFKCKQITSSYKFLVDKMALYTLYYFQNKYQVTVEMQMQHVNFQKQYLIFFFEGVSFFSIYIFIM